MRYHLKSHDQEIGPLTLEELQRRRQSGELTGNELVRLEGSDHLQPLDEVVGPGRLAQAIQPPPIPVTKRKWGGLRLYHWALLILAVLVVFGVGLIMEKGAQKIVDQFTGESYSSPDPAKIAGQDIIPSSRSITVAETRKQGRAFVTRQWLDGYKANGKREAPCDGEVIQMIQAWIEGNWGSPGTNAADISQWCDRLVKQPACDDPLVLTIAGVNSIETHEKAIRLERALGLFAQSKHKAYPKFYALMNYMPSETNPVQRQRLMDQGVEWLKACFEDGSFRPEDQSQIAEILMDGWGKSFFTEIRSRLPEIRGSGKSSFEWLWLVLNGEAQVKEAWQARGSDFSDRVTQQGWDGFGRHLAGARRDFTRAWELKPELPLAPAKMIGVALGDSDLEEMRVWFDRALAAQIDYPLAWSNFRWGLQLRWYGSLEAILALGKTAARTERFDTDVPRMMLDAIADLESEMKLPFGHHLYGRGDIWPALSRMYEGYIARHAGQENEGGWRSAYAVLAYLAGQYEVSRSQLEILNWKPWPYNLSGWGRELSLMSLEVAARSSSVGAKVAAAENSFQLPDRSPALKLYQELAGSPGLDPRTAEFVKIRLATLTLEERMKAGEWVDFLPQGTNDPTWVLVKGHFRREGDGPLEVAADKEGHLLYSLVRPGMDFEIRGSLEVVRTSNNDFQGGLVMGLPNYWATDWHSFRLKQNREEGGLASLARGWSSRQVAKEIALDPRTNSFEFRLQKGRVTASVNGVKIMENAKPPATRLSTTDFFIGLGAFNDMNDTVLRYHQVELRRLPLWGN